MSTDAAGKRPSIVTSAGVAQAPNSRAAKWTPTRRRRAKRRLYSKPVHGIRTQPVRRLLYGPPAATDRVLFVDTWFRGHVNQRYAELLPRLERVEPHLFVCSDRRLVRGAQFRALRASRRIRYRVVLASAAKRYSSLLVADRRQIAYFAGRIVADCDDPKFTAEEIELLKRPNVAAYAVVNERVRKRFEELGVDKPCYVIPHGVALNSIDPSTVAEVAGRHRRDGEVVVGYMASWLLSRDDRGGQHSVYNVDHLLDLWDEISQKNPGACLWLLGGASKRIRSRCAAREDIRLLGRIPRDQVLEHVANFDVALYPRTEDRGYQASKVVEYMGCGVPIVSYDYEVTADIREAGAGLLVDTPREFVGAVERLAANKPLRAELGARGRRAAAARDWDELARQYSAIFDRHL
jgi:glycosyltransferase involved in cell wall biosynthesis